MVFAPVSAPPPPADPSSRAREALAFFRDVLADRGLLVHLDAALRRELLETAGHLLAHRGLLVHLAEARQRELLETAGPVARPDPWQKREFLREARRQRKEHKRAEDERKLSSTGIRRGRRDAVFVTPPALPAP